MRRFFIMSSIFSDRFTKDNPALQGIDINTLSETELLNLSPELMRMVESVRRVDVVLSQTPAQQIYFVITEYADPKIGGILAAARDKNTNIRLFSTIEQVKQIMYPYKEFEDLEWNIFNDTIRQVSVTLTASRLVGNLSAAGKNFSGHSEHLMESAIADLERIITTIELDGVNSATQSNQEEESVKLYWERGEYNLQSEIVVEVFLSGTTTSWELIGNYTGRITTSQLVADIANAINGLTLSSGSSNIIAAPILSEESLTHSIEFKARSFSTKFSAELVSVRFNWSVQSNRLPFKWGIDPSNLANYEINSVLVTNKMGRVSTDGTVPKLDEKEGVPSVLYIRRRAVSSGTPLDDSGNPLTDWKYTSFKYRISPLQSSATQVPFPDSYTTDNARPSHFALQLLNELHKHKKEYSCVGSIVKSDPFSVDRPLVAVELIAFKLMKTETYLVLDLLSLPADLEIAIGDLTQPLTSFSNNPRSIRVETKYDLSVQEVKEDETPSNNPIVTRRKMSGFLEQIRSKTHNWEQLR